MMEVNSNGIRKSGFNKRQMNPEEELSRALSWALRHAAPQLRLDMSEEGYVPVSQILASNHPKFANKKFTELDVRSVVEKDSKQRFHLECRQVSMNLNSSRINKRQKQESDNSLKTLKVLCIRANQGHSIKNISSEKLLSPILPSVLKEMDTVVHGTYLTAWERIKIDGLSRMKRNHIHLAKGLPGEDGVISGMRKNCEVYIYINTRLCAEDNIRFYESANGVILTEGVHGSGTLPTTHFSKVVHAVTGEVLFTPDAETSTVL